MNKKIELTEMLAYRILKFFARHLGFHSFRVCLVEDHTWRLEFYNSSSRAGIVRVLTRVSNHVVDVIRFGHKPTFKDVVDELLMFASNGDEIASLTSSYHTMTLMQPFTTIEELLVKMDLELFI